MSIVLTEIRGEQKLARREFKQATVKIGRDPVRSNLAFERRRWPMVSRLHAEIRSEGGHWFLTDAGSRHGTLLNGQTISAATEIESDRKSTRLNSSHLGISYAVFCLK